MKIRYSKKAYKSKKLLKKITPNQGKAANKYYWFLMTKVCVAVTKLTIATKATIDSISNFNNSNSFSYGGVVSGNNIPYVVPNHTEQVYHYVNTLSLVYEIENTTSEAINLINKI